MEKRGEIEYNGYFFCDRVPLITRCDQMMSYFDGKFENINIDKEEIEQTIHDTLDESLDEKFCQVHHHIDDAKCHLCCNMATKEQVNSATNRIIAHIDDVVNEINFEEKFSDLNEQAVEILNKLNNL